MTSPFSIYLIQTRRPSVDKPWDVKSGCDHTGNMHLARCFVRGQKVCKMQVVL